MRRTTICRTTLLPFLLTMLAACATGGARPKAVNTETRALIYGHIEGPKAVQAVELAKMLSPRRPKAHVTERGDFFFEDVEPGDYGLLRFGAGGEWYLLLTGDKENNRRFIVKATPGGIHYAGSWRVTGEKDNRFSPDEFSIERMDAPGRQAVLERLRPALAGTGWEKKIGGGKTSDAGGAKPTGKSEE